MRETGREGGREEVSGEGGRERERERGGDGQRAGRGSRSARATLSHGRLGLSSDEGRSELRYAL